MIRGDRRRAIPTCCQRCRAAVIALFEDDYTRIGSHYSIFYVLAVYGKRGVKRGVGPVGSRPRSHFQESASTLTTVSMPGAQIKLCS